MICTFGKSLDNANVYRVAGERLDMKKDAIGNSGTTFCSSALQHWGVEVRVNGEHVLTMESNCLSGRELSDIDEHAIRTSAQHLLAFVGEESREVKKEREAMRSEIVKIAAACARFQHMYVEDLQQDDLKQFGAYANKLKSIFDRM